MLLALLGAVAAQEDVSRDGEKRELGIYPNPGGYTGEWLVTEHVFGSRLFDASYNIKQRDEVAPSGLVVL